MGLALVKTNKYNGKYVALDDSQSGKVVASGKDASKVFAVAQERGYDLPTLVYIPKKDEVHIY